MLSYPDYSKQFVINTDACNDGKDTVLSQDIDKEERVIQFISRTLIPAEKKLCVREKEALAIVYGCESFHPYVYGSPFIVETDHHSLQWLMMATSPARLVQYNFEIRYKKGTANVSADTLSAKIPAALKTKLGVCKKTKQFIVPPPVDWQHNSKAWIIEIIGAKWLTDMTSFFERKNYFVRRQYVCSCRFKIMQHYPTVLSS